jgi:hypothetical protein
MAQEPGGAEMGALFQQVRAAIPAPTGLDGGALAIMAVMWEGYGIRSDLSNHNAQP